MVTVTSRLSSEKGIIQRPKKVAGECDNLKLSADSPWEEFQVNGFFVCLIVLFCFPKDECTHIGTLVGLFACSLLDALSSSSFMVLCVHRNRMAY